MKTSKLKAIQDGKDYNGKYGLQHAWWVTMENGDHGSVNTQPGSNGERRAPWSIGADTHYEIGRIHEGKNGEWYSMKKVVPEEASNGYSQSKPSGGSEGWGPEKEASVMTQGFIKSIIESGMESKNWKAALDMAISLHDEAVTKRMENNKPAAPVTNDAQEAYQAPRQPDKGVPPSMRKPLPTNPDAPPPPPKAAPVPVDDDLPF